MGRNMRYCTAILLVMISQVSYSAVNLVEKDNWKIDVSGFLETDFFHDTTRSFAEVIGNSPVVPPNGELGRTQFSVRNSRLAFNVMAPIYENWKSRGYMEFDLMGFDPAPGASNTEAGYFNNPTFRLRHGYVNTEKNGWQFLVG